MENNHTPEILSPEEWFEKEWNGNQISWDINDIKKYAEYYYQSMLQQSIPTEDEINEYSMGMMMNWLTSNNPDRDFTNSTIGADDNRAFWESGFKAAINHLTKGGKNE